MQTQLKPRNAFTRAMARLLAALLLTTAPLGTASAQKGRDTAQQWE